MNTKLLLTLLLTITLQFSYAQIDSLKYGLKGKVIRALAKSPNSPTTFYAGLKGDKMGTGLIYKSSDDGKSWYALNDGKSISPYTSDIQAIAIDKDNNIYAGTWKDGLYKSEDDGDTWQKIYSIPTSDVRSIKTGIQTSGLVYASTSAFGVIKSTDGGKTWKRNEADEIENSFKFAWSIELDPKNDNIIYAQTYSDGVWKSIDQGESWKQILPIKDQVCWDLKVSKNSNLIWLVASKSRDSLSSVHYSEDQGETWKELENVPQIGISQINVIEESGKNIIFIGSWKDGIYVLENTNWKKVETIDYETISEILLNNNELIIGSWGNGIYSHPIKNGIWCTREIGIPAEFGIIERKILMPDNGQVVKEQVLIKEPRIKFISVLCKENLNSERIRIIGTALIKKGYQVRNLPQISSEELLEVLKKFQKENNLEDIGYYTGESLKKLGVNF